jgi:hypothetical protein
MYVGAPFETCSRAVSACVLQQQKGQNQKKGFFNFEKNTACQF